MAVAIGCVVALTLPVVAATNTIELQHRVAGAADAAALAAADAAAGWITGEPCEIAQRVVSAMDTELTSCEYSFTTGEARVTVAAGNLLGSVESQARAGPAW